jgi:hypothetical protein
MAAKPGKWWEKVEEVGHLEDRECDGESCLLKGPGNSGNIKRKWITERHPIRYGNEKSG